jgi:hypothetical protein
MDNIKIDLRETAWGGMDWIHLAWDKDQWRATCIKNSALKLRVW